MPFVKWMPDKCNPPVDMGRTTVFAEAIPGRNDNYTKPFGWTEYEAAYRHQYVPDPCPARRCCVDTCRPRGTDRKANPRQFFNRGRVPRQRICNICNMARCCCPIPPPWDECKEKVVVYDPDSVRNLYVHGELKNEHPFVLSGTEYGRVITEAIVQSKEEKEEECNAKIREKAMARERCQEFADELRLIDKYKFNASISPEAREDMEEVICRAEKILKNDEPEVRTVNKVILAAKVQAIREAQLAEKELIKCEQAEEERRLLALIEQDKGKALIKDDDEEVKLECEKKHTLMAALKAQLDQQEAMKFWSKEKQEAERAQMRQMWEQWDVEEMTKRALADEKKHQLGVELLEDQIKHVEMQKELKEMDKQLDQKMVEWQKQKAAEEEKQEQEKKQAKKMKDLAVLQVLETQKRTSDSKAIRDEMRAKRHMEQQEREWRRKERDEAMLRQKNSEELKVAILDQIQYRQNFFADQAAFDKAVYDKIFNIQDDRMEEEKKKEEERLVRNAQYKYDLREQIHRFQMGKVQERKEHYIEGIDLRKQLSRRDQEIRCTMETKLDELRDSCLPEKYINYIRKAVDEELKPEWRKSMSKK